MLLARDARQGGKKGGCEIKRKFKRFLSFQWAPLLSVLPRERPRSADKPSDDARHCLLRQVDHHVCEGNISRAARLLTSSGLAPDTPDTLDRLRAKHPQFSGSSLSPEVGSEPAITLQRDIFLNPQGAQLRAPLGFVLNT